MIEVKPYSIHPDVPNNEANQFVISSFEQLVDEYADPSQKDEYKTHFIDLLSVIDEDFEPEELARLQGDPVANLFWHNRHHLRQAAFDNINVARVSIEKELIPPFLAFQMPEDGYGHDWGYIGELNESFPTYANLIAIHVPKSLGRLVSYRKQNPLSFLTDQQHEMTLWTSAMATHATHFADDEAMKIYAARRRSMIRKFAANFKDLYGYHYLRRVGRDICDGSQFADLAQTADPAYFERLPGLAIEMNAVEPGRGDKIIGTNLEEYRNKSAWFIENKVRQQRVGLTARRLFGKGNAYEVAWNGLLLPTQRQNHRTKAA